MVIGAAMAPGLSCVLAALPARPARSGSTRCTWPASAPAARPAPGATTPPSPRPAVDWEEGDWRRRPGGSGRELVWFPEPVGGADCYRAGLADPLLLVPAFPGCRRVTSRLEATRRDRSPPGCRCCAPLTPRGLRGPSGWRCGAGWTAGPRPGSWGWRRRRRWWPGPWRPGPPCGRPPAGCRVRGRADWRSWSTPRVPSCGSWPRPVSPSRSSPAGTSRRPLL